MKDVTGRSRIKKPERRCNTEKDVKDYKILVFICKIYEYLHIFRTEKPSGEIAH